MSSSQLTAAQPSPDTDYEDSPAPSDVSLLRRLSGDLGALLREAFARRPAAERVELRELAAAAAAVDVGHEPLVAVLRYLYSGRVETPPREACTCADEESCAHVACRPAVDFMAQALYVAFLFEVFELANLFQRRLLDVIDSVAVDDLLIIVSVSNICSKYCSRLLSRCTHIIVESDLDVVTLEKTLPPDIVREITNARVSLGLVAPESRNFSDNHMKRIHRALDSDDVELVRLLLKEGSTTLDDACALHYAVAHCDSKTTIELLDLNLADVNHRNVRGYTVLHVAAIRRDPKIIVSLRTKGARPSDLTPDGRKAVDISRRLTKISDYCKAIEEGEPSPKDRLCIEILELAERRHPQLGEASVSLAMAGDDVRGRLLYLENRVALARMLFPMEARVAMETAQVDGTLEFNLGSTCNYPNGSKRAAVDLNETPFTIKEEHLARMKALSRTVELGKRFFPRCSDVLDKIMDDELTELTCLGRDKTGEKRRRFHELQGFLKKAFNEDKQEYYDRSALSSSSSSTSIGMVWG